MIPMLKLIPSALTFSWSGLTIPDYLSMWKVVSTTLEKRHVANTTVSLTGWFIFSWKAYLHCRLSAILGISRFILVENVWNKVFRRHENLKLCQLKFLRSEILLLAIKTNFSNRQSFITSVLTCLIWQNILWKKSLVARFWLFA